MYIHRGRLGRQAKSGGRNLARRLLESAMDHDDTRVCAKLMLGGLLWTDHSGIHHDRPGRAGPRNHACVFVKQKVSKEQIDLRRSVGLDLASCIKRWFKSV